MRRQAFQTGPSTSRGIPASTNDRADRSRNTNMYGEGAPQGDPFVVPPPTGPIYRDARPLGYGPPPITPKHRSVSFETPNAALQNRMSGFHRTTSANNLAGGGSNTQGYNFSVLNTPTQTNVRQSSAQSMAHHRQFVIQEEPSPMDLLLESIHLLRGDMLEVKQRLSSIETSMSRRHPSPPRGLAAQRGGRIAHDSDADSAAADSATTTDFSTDMDDGPGSAADEDDGVTLASVDVSAKERRALQTYVTQTTRRLCNVVGRRWPDPDIPRMNAVTQEVYITPKFVSNVKDPHNAALLRKVAERAFAELQDRDKWPEGLDPQRGPSFDLAYLVALAKKSFNSLKKGWKEVQQIEVAISADTNRRNHRRMMRRKRKSETLAEALNTFAAEHALDPAMLIEIIHEQFLSDELSGPDSDTGETNDAWKVRLAAAAGLATSPELLAKFEIFEITVPDWRSRWFSNLIHDMEAQAGLDKKLKYHRIDVGRPSDRIPRWAPYNFGISSDWWGNNGTVRANKKLLKEWMEWPEPEGCGLIFERDDDGEIINMSYAQNISS
ncbi:hypothetical protein R3P38DRAFT_2518795 [Favolaschia claudopus]|uniref:Uncharacterized protein n=1 Tax=Favolaschia claudopus TaxID=2862362 RepID=A0AAW0C8A8_9AGAR